MVDQNKVCPVVFRNCGQQVLLFLHPSAGLQLVQGSIRPGETVFQAAARELCEKSGLSAGYMARIFEAEIASARWLFVTCDAEEIAEVWEWQTLDDRGHNLVFFWHDLSSPLPPNCGAPFRTALNLVRNHIRYESE